MMTSNFPTILNPLYLFRCKHNHAYRAFIITALMIVHLFSASVCFAIELSTHLNEQEMIISVRDINYPEQLLHKQLNSGLPNNISLLLSLKQNDNIISMLKYNYQITYDLWDEVYLVVESSIYNNSISKLINNETELMNQLNQLNFSSREFYVKLQPKEQYQVTLQVLVNPVTAQRINKIRTWIANSQGHTLDLEQNQQNKPPPVTVQPIVTKLTNPQNRVSSTRSGRPRFQKLFDQLLEQHLASAQMPALWRSDIISTSINLASSGNE